MTKKAKSTFAKNVIKRRKALGWNAETLAEKANIPYPTLRDIEIGRSGGREKTKEAIAHALGYSVDDLMINAGIQKISPMESYERAKKALSDPIDEMGLEFGLEVLQRLLDADPRHRAMVIAFLYNEPSLAGVLPKEKYDPKGKA